MPARRCPSPPFDPTQVRLAASLLQVQAPLLAWPGSGPDPEVLLHLARYWHVAPVLWLRLRDCAGLPAPLRDGLRVEYWENVRRNAQLRRAANDLFRVLARVGIEPVMLKGGCQLFDPPSGNAGTRVMVDLDLLAPPGRDECSFDALVQEGFLPAPDWETELYNHWPKLERTVDGLPLVVEVHKSPWLGSGRGEAEAVWARSRPIADAAAPARLPCEAHRLIHNAAHAFTDAPFNRVAIYDPDEFDLVVGCTDLRQLHDFAELASLRSAVLDWPAIVAEADRFGRGADLRQWAYLARTLLAAPVPDLAVAWDVARPETRGLSGRGRSLGKRVLRSTGLLGPIRRWKARVVDSPSVFR